jgi:hypothetical protein
VNKYRGFEILWFQDDNNFDVIKVDEPLLLCKNMSTVEDCLRKIDEYWEHEFNRV